jgi:salicylate hydroxylase
MLPFLAQGANQAVEDAVVLAAALRGAAPAEVPERLRRYDAVRRPRADAVAGASRAAAARLHAEPVPGPVDGRRGLAALAWLYGHDDGAPRPTAVPRSGTSV